MNARVLVVDDDATVAEVVVDYLRQAGMESRHVPDGPAALALALQWRPDLVVLDLMLPGMDGLEVCRRLRAAWADEAEPAPLPGWRTYSIIVTRSARPLMARISVVARRLCSVCREEADPDPLGCGWFSPRGALGT